MRAHLPDPLLVSARTAEPRERPRVGARFESEVEQLEHVCIDRVNRQGLSKIKGIRMEAKRRYESNCCLWDIKKGGGVLHDT